VGLRPPSAIKRCSPHIHISHKVVRNESSHMRNIKRIIKNICKDNEHIGLSIINGEVSWKDSDNITSTDWKHIGYLGGLQAALDNILSTRLEAVHDYVDLLEKNQTTGKSPAESYKEIVNIFRVESGKPPIDYKVNREKFKKFIDA